MMCSFINNPMNAVDRCFLPIKRWVIANSNNGHPQKAVVVRFSWFVTRVFRSSQKLLVVGGSAGTPFATIGLKVKNDLGFALSYGEGDSRNWLDRGAPRHFFVQVLCVVSCEKQLGDRQPDDN